MTDRNEMAQPAPLGQVERGVGPLAETAEAWLFFCSRPGRRMVFASVEESGSESWPWDEWTHVQRVALVPAGERVTLLDKRPNARVQPP
jgi:hypothetical protein